MNTWFGVVLSMVLVSTPLYAQMTGAPMNGYRRETAAPASAIPAPLREVGFDQRLDQPLPLDTRFTDEEGHEVRIGQYFGTRPVVLGFVYYDCPMLCGQIVNALTSTLRTMSLDAGRDFDVVLVSFDPRETPALAAAKKAEYLARYDRSGAAAGWHFLTGQPASIERLTQAAGFRYAWDEATKQFAHPAGIIVVTPDGRPARYLFGLEYGPRDVRLALVEASEGKVGSAVDSILLYCYHYDPMTGRYGFLVMRAIRIAGVATVLALGSFIFLMVRRDRHANRLRSLRPSHFPSRLSHRS
jgi:protein SCO1/2